MRYERESKISNQFFNQCLTKPAFQTSKNKRIVLILLMYLFLFLEWQHIQVGAVESDDKSPINKVFQ